MELNGFEKLISNLPKDSTVLDIGSGGLEGENTTRFLLDRFEAKNIVGICNNQKGVDLFLAQLKEAKADAPVILLEDYNEYQTDRQYDIVVHDLNIENSLQLWSEEGLERAFSFVKDGGLLITYVMMTDQYGDPDETPALIRRHRDEFWWSTQFNNEMIGRRLNEIDGFEIVGVEREKRRPYIYWVALEKDETVV